MRCLVLAGLLVSAAPAAAVSGYFPTAETTTILSSQPLTASQQAAYLGAPDRNWLGIGAQFITYDLGNVRVVNGTGMDFVVYEEPSGIVEFNLVQVSVSADNVNFWELSPITNPIRIDGDEAHINVNFRRGYDVDAAVTNLGVDQFRFIKLQGTSGTQSFGPNLGFDPDALGLINFVDLTPPPPPISGVVPEPSSWALLITGFGLVGAGLRRRRAQLSRAAA